MAELAKAYVQIIPTTKGIKEKLKEEMDPPLKENGKESGESFGSMLVGGIQNIIGGYGPMLSDMLDSAIAEGSDLEQSVGGIETLYKDAADIVIENAAKAYKTAGLSANDYMETVSSFSASLLSSLGGDTVAAANAANDALIAMSDNSNKMGTDMESIMNAYMGFSKQNYTMLDNLKIGYGGTKKEAERLLADAEKITGVKYNIDNINDVYSAISVIQDELDITGTTAKEASTTLSGSFASMQTAAQNLLGYMVTGMDVRPAVEQLIETATTYFFGNLVPAVGRVIVAVPAALKAFVVAAVPELKSLVQLGITYATSGAPKSMLDAGSKMVQSLVSGAKAKAPEFGKVAIDAIAKFLAVLLSNAPKFLESGLQLIGKLIAGFIAAIPKVVAAIPKLTAAAKTAFDKYDWKSIGINIIKGIAKGLSGAAGEIASAAKDAASKALESAKDFLGIHSPSTVAEKTIGAMLPAGAARGIRKNAHLPALEMRRMGIESVNSGYEAISSSVRTFYGSLDSGPVQQSGASDGVRELVRLLKQLVDKKQDVYLSNGALVGGLLDDMDVALQRKFRRTRRGGA